MRFGEDHTESLCVPVPCNDTGHTKQRHCVHPIYYGRRGLFSEEAVCSSFGLLAVREGRVPGPSPTMLNSTSGQIRWTALIASIRYANPFFSTKRPANKTCRFRDSPWGGCNRRVSTRLVQSNLVLKVTLSQHHAADEPQNRDEKVYLGLRFRPATQKQPTAPILAAERVNDSRVLPMTSADQRYPKQLC